MPEPIAFNDLIRAKLPFWRTIKNAYILTLGNLGTLLGFAAKPLALLIPLTFAYNWYTLPILKTIMGDPTNAPPSDMAMLAYLNLPFLAASYAIVSPAAVDWLRFLLRNEGPPAAPDANGRLVRFAATYVGMSLAMLAPSTLQQVLAPNLGANPSGLLILAYIASGLLGLVTVVLFYRLSVVLPAIAVDSPDQTLAGAFRASRSHTIRMVFGNLFSIALLTIPGVLIFFFISRYLDTVPGALLQTATNLLGYAGLAVSWTFMALAYRHFYELTKPGEV